MAFIQTQVKGTLFDRFEIVIKTKIKNFRQFKLYRKTVAELSALPARELSDLGISKSMIQNVAYEAVYESRDSRKEML